MPVTTTVVTLAPLSGTDADALIYGTRWGDGTGAILSYSFPGAASAWDVTWYPIPGSEPYQGFAALGGSEQEAVRAALSGWGSVANVSFLEVADGAATSGTVRFGYTSWDMSPTLLAYAYVPDPGAIGGDVWLNAGLKKSVFADLGAGELGSFALLHEIGHTLGLKHPHEASAYSPATLDWIEDSVFNTVMSYHAWPGVALSATSIDRLPSTPMSLDIDALQALYGANTASHAGDDTYVFNSAGKYLETLYDTGGNDTIVLVGGTGGEIDLRPGEWSRLGVPVQINGGAIQSADTVRIYHGTLIENATGGAGNDTLIGNEAANTLVGNGGNDVLDGGAGVNAADYEDAPSGTTVDLSTGTASDGFGGADTLISIQNVTGSAFSDTLTGGTDNNVLEGGAGDDSMRGLDGNDVMVGGDGNDSMNGNVGNDTVDGGAGNDFVLGGKDNDSVLGGAGDDTINGNIGNDVVHGGDGNDIVHGGQNEDLVFGGNGNDLVTGDLGDDTLDGGAGDDTLNGGAGVNAADYEDAPGGTVIDLSLGTASDGFGGTDTLISIQNVAGSAFSDTLTGGTDANVLDGGAGDDSLRGLDGDDVLLGGDGNDTMNGNVGADTVDGGLGNDFVLGGKDNDWVYGGLGDDNINGNLGNDTVDGGDGNDTVHGGQNEDLLFGNVGNELLTGDLGNDTLVGGVGDDTLTGGAGSDVFRYDALSLGSADVTANGHDVITDGTGELISMLGLTDELHIGGMTLNALAVDTALGGAIDAGNSVAFAGGVLEIDVNGDGAFNAANDFQISVTGVTTVTYNATDDLFHLA